MNRITLGFGGAVLIACALLVSRQRALHELQSHNATLRQELALRRALPAVAGESTQPLPPSLTPEERRELLRLRGEVGPLRQALRVPSQTRDPSREAVSAQVQASGIEAPKIHPEVEALMRSAEYRAAHLLARVLVAYLKEHDGQLPSEPPRVESANEGPVVDGVGARFEMIQSERVPEAARPYTLVAREKEARQLADGAWVRLYILANGGVAVAGPAPEPDWPGWERFNQAMGKEEARRQARSRSGP